MTIRRGAVFTLGWALVLGGIVGLFLPVVPGALLMVAGGAILTPQSVYLRRALEKCRMRVRALKRPFARFASAGMWRSRFTINPDNSSSQFQNLKMTHVHRSSRGSKMKQRTAENTDRIEMSQGTAKVLVFTQDVTDLNRYSEPFEARGCEVHKCISAESAMRCLERESLDFALVDQGSPIFEGIRVIKHLIRYNLRTPFVVITRSNDVLGHQQALALGAMEYLEKPASRADVDCIVEKYLGTSIGAMRSTKGF